MEPEPLTTEEKFLEAYRIVFNTKDIIPNDNVDPDSYDMQDDWGFQEYRMLDEDMPLIDACPFYGELDA